MGILAYYVRFHGLALLYFLQSFTAYVFHHSTLGYMQLVTSQKELFPS